MNKLTALALIMVATCVAAACGYSIGKRNAKSKQVNATKPTAKPHKIVVDVQTLPNIPTRFGAGVSARNRANIAFAEAVRTNAERKASNGNR